MKTGDTLRYVHVSTVVNNPVIIVIVELFTSTVTHIRIDNYINLNYYCIPFHATRNTTFRCVQLLKRETTENNEVRNSS